MESNHVQFDAVIAGVASPSAPASSASPAPDGLPVNEVPQVERKGPRGGRSRGASGVARTPGPTWVGHPAGAALESAPERAVAARRFRFRVAARPAAVARRPMGAAPSAPKPVPEAWSRGADRGWSAVADAPSAPARAQSPGAAAEASRSDGAPALYDWTIWRRDSAAKRPPRRIRSS